MSKIEVLNKIFKFERLSNYFKSGSRNINNINTIVLHWTGGSTLKSAVDTLEDRGLGYHFLIDNDGGILQGNKLSDRAFHAGSSYGPKGKDLNTYSIGISIVATYPGKGNDINTKQIESVKNLIENIMDSEPFKSNIKWITGHHEISPGRKDDPYTLDFNSIVTDLKSRGKDINFWRAGMEPFPIGLSDCKCNEKSLVKTNFDVKYYTKSIGNCIGQGGQSYKPERVTKNSNNADKDTNPGQSDTKTE